MPQHWYSRTGEMLPEGFGYPSVTTILAIRHNAGLQAWRDRVGAEEADAHSKKSTDLGTAVHNILEAKIKAKQWALSADNVNPAYVPFLQGFVAWCEKYQPREMKSEVFLYHELHEYAGTADLICTIDGEPTIVDFKTSKHIHPEYALQLAAYAEAYKYMTGIECRRGVLQLTDQIKRGYRFKAFTDENDFGVFMAHKEVFDWARETESKQSKFMRATNEKLQDLRPVLPGATN